MPDLRKILVLANTDWFLANFMSAFLAAHLRAGIDVVVGSPSGSHVGALQRSGLRWVEIPMSRGRGSVGSNMRAMAAIHRLHRSIRPDLTHFVTAKPAVLGNLVLSVQDAPRVINVLPGLGHAFTARGGPAWIDRQLLLWGVRRAAARPRSLTVFHTQADQGVILGNSERRLGASRIIPGWGVDLTMFSRVRRPAEPPLVIMVSRMLWSKGVGDFVEAARVCRKTASVRFALVGDPDPGNPAPIPIGQLEEWQREGEVEWWGHREDIPEVLTQASVVALPSHYGEGAPQSLIEAAAMGVPIVASDLPGCREVVENGGNGFLVRPGDVDGLVDAVLRLVRDPELRQRMGTQGREFARQRFATERIAARYADLYRELGLRCNL